MIYFDHNATTRLDPEVLEAMLPYLMFQQGNPSSRHTAGRKTQKALEQARQQVASAVNVQPAQVVFTSGGTEANNLAIHGLAHYPGQVLVSAIEHPSVLKAAQALPDARCRTISVQPDSRLDEAHLLELLRDKTALVSVMAANNETGAIQNLSAIAQQVRQHHGIFHTDAVQALGKITVDFAASGAHAMSLSAHKINGPQGAGALIIDKRIDLQPLIYGGGQEKSRRSGTENIAAIVGFGAACALLPSRSVLPDAQVLSLRTQLEQGLRALGATIFGDTAERLPNTSYFAFPQIDGETLVMALDRKGYAVASGSACSSSSTEPSHVLLAMQVVPKLARNAVRVSLANSNTAGEVATFINILEQELHHVRHLAAKVG